MRSCVSLLIAALAAACDPADAVIEAAAVDGCCQLDRDCAAGAACVSSDGGCGTCVAFLCSNDDQCGVGEVCDENRGRCEVPLTCDGGAPQLGCDPSQQCLVTDASECRTPQSADSCSLWPPSGPLLGRLHAIELVGRGADGRLIPAGRGTISATDGVVGNFAPDQFLFSAECPGPNRCEVVVTGAIDMARCQARYVLLGALGDDDARVVIRDADSGAALAGADVTMVAGGSVVAGRSDGDGVFFAPGVGDVDRVVVVHDGYDGVTCVDCDDDVAFALRRTISPEATPAISGGIEVRGGFGDLVFGLGGLALSSPSFEAQHLFGISGSIPFEVEGLTSAGSRLAFSSGAVFRLGTEVFRPSFTAIGRPLQRSAWLLGGHLRLGGIGDILVDAASDDPQLDSRLELLRVAAPGARSGIVGTVMPTPLAVPGARARLEDVSVNVNVEGLADVDVAAEVEVVVGDAFPQGSTDVMIIVGAVIPGDGLIPLGGAVVALADAAGRAVVPFAPPHDGLEGRALRIVLVPTSGTRLSAEDRFGGTRIVLPVAGPGPDRALVARVPDDMPLAAVVGVGEDSVVEAMVGADDVRHDVIVSLNDGRRHRIMAPASEPLVVGPLLLELERLSAADVDVDSLDVGASSGADDELFPWRGASFTRRR